MNLGDQGGPSLGGIAGAVPGFTVAYLGAEATMSGPIHPIHWIVAFGGGVFGYLAGHVVWLYREGLLELPMRKGTWRRRETRGRSRRRR